MTPAASPFCVDSLSLAATGSGALDGLRFGAKDVFDVAGHVTGCGNPDWRRSHPPAGHTASAIEALRAAGAQMLGKTLTDELAYSLNGENWHYGTPPNPRAPGRIPGGSSSGSASAVALDLVDFAIGTDCGGSVRLPASFCGLHGMRPTHGRISTDGLVPLAASFDTVGWFAGSAELLKRVGGVLLGDGGPASAPCRLLIAEDLFAQLGDAEREALQPALARLRQRFVDVSEIAVGNRDPDELMQAFRTLQAAEIWAAHGHWITEEKPRFGPGIAQRFANASRVTQTDVSRAQDVRDSFRRHLSALLTPGSLLCLPSAPGIAPALDTPVDAMELFRGKAMRLLCIAGLAGTPQASLPVATLEGKPLGLSLMMSPGADRALLDFVAANALGDTDTEALDLNRPDVLAEVRAAFARYEHALVHNEVAVLDHLFWDSGRTVRYGDAENLYGAEQIREFRAGRPSTGLMRSLQNTVITTFGTTCATACTEFTRPGSRRSGRQTQTWIRTPAGWKVVAAHVSSSDPPSNEDLQETSRP